MLHTFYTVSDFNYAILCFLSVLFLLSIKNKSYNVYNLAFLFFILGIMALAYYFSFGYIQEYWAYHRWISVGVSLIGTAQLSNFLFHYPRDKWKKIHRIVYLYHFLNIVVVSLFVYASFTADKHYNFQGHFWDLDLPLLSRIVGFLILLLMILAIITGFFKAFLEQKDFRFQILLITIGFIFIIFIPGLTNMLNRMYILPRDIHHNFWVLFGIIGSFMVLITYANYTKEKTTLLTKIYAISIASLLVIVQFSSYIILKDREEMYDQQQNYKSGRIIKDDFFRPEDLLTYGKINYKKNQGLEIKEIFNSKDNEVSISDIINKNESILQIYLFQLERDLFDIKNFNEDDIKYIISYMGWYNDLNNRGYDKDQILNEIYSKRNQILHLRTLIQDLPQQNFRQKFEKDIYQKYKNHEIYKYFLNHIGLNKDKKEVLDYIPVFYKRGDRIYQYVDHQNLEFWKKSFITYYVELNDELFYIVYSYKSYRNYIHIVASILLKILILSTIAILISYPVFFYLAIIKPLRKLVHGLQEVDKGNFNVSIDISVEDEIGYVTKSFNKMVDSIKLKNQQLEEYASGLEEKVKERTKDLENSLRQIESLKQKQDGDYFLTSLLLKPLNKNEIIDNNIVKVDVKLDQYKKFQFKHWKSEIGGDFVSAYQFKLMGKSYVFAVNADAMGKSIQGAGGALVLGSVLEAIVERTKYDVIAQEQYPEKWLKNAFIELHKVFESFNGSMLVSCILLLLDEKEGCLYYINAEHPHLVLYRDGKSMFLIPKKNFMKLGVSIEGLLEISVFKLNPKDKLIMGSDGKDDLVLSINDSIRNINQDENLFLGVVNEANGFVDLIYENLKEKGEFMDDVSIISIEYNGDYQWLRQTRYMSKEDKHFYDSLLKEIETENFSKVLIGLNELIQRYPDNGIILKRLGYVKIKMGNYIEGLQDLERSFTFLPWDNEILKMLAKGYVKINDFEKAMIYGDLYITRDCTDIDMLNYMIKIYEELKNTKYHEVAIKRINKYKNIVNQFS